MNTFKKTLMASALIAMALPSQAATYAIDTNGSHAFVQFKIKHLGHL